MRRSILIIISVAMMGGISLTSCSFCKTSIVAPAKELFKPVKELFKKKPVKSIPPVVESGSASAVAGVATNSAVPTATTANTAKKESAVKNDGNKISIKKESVNKHEASNKQDNQHKSNSLHKGDGIVADSHGDNNAHGGETLPESKTEILHDRMLPGDRQSIAVKKEMRNYTQEEIGRGLVKGDWAIMTVYGKEAVGEKVPFLKFVPGENRVYGNNGCNVLNASYKVNPADSTLKFSNMASTMMLCNMEGLTDYEVNSALGMTSYYSIKMQGADYWMTFYDSLRKPVMTLMHQNFDFLNGAWQITQINGISVDNPDMTLVIDVDSGRLHGNTGCNILNGMMTIDMENANSISFSEIATTKMACPNDSMETELLVALEETEAARLLSSTEVALLNSQRKVVLKLVRTAFTED